MSAADRHPSRYRPPLNILGPVPDGEVMDGIVAEEVPHLIAGVEFLLGLTSPTVQARWCALAPYREP